MKDYTSKLYGFRYLVLLVLMPFAIYSQETNSSVFFQVDNFKRNTEDWIELNLGGSSNGTRVIEEGTLKLTGVSDGYFGTLYNKAITGHFIVDLDFDTDENIGLALIHSKNGKPDPENYTLLTVDQVDNLVVVEVKDRQKGVDNVLDHTGKTNFDRKHRFEEGINLGNDLYQHILTGDQYSVPFTGTNGKIRIFREVNGGMLHYYYQVKKTYNGQDYVDWMELRPSPDWSNSDTEFFVGIVALHEGDVEVKSVSAISKPTRDIDDRNTGFEVTQREYNWSGFIGEGYVVSFDETFDYHKEDMKFVFWTEMNYIPAWHLNNQLLYTYEFVETWDDNVAGCHEPMSDRIRQWTWVKVLEDNPVRKVLQWHYVLSNPDYDVPAEGRGKQLPEVDEFWTFYPDGSGIRHVRYTPKLDTDFRAPHELSEMISVAGSKSHSEDFYDAPALSILNMEGNLKQAHPGPKFDYYSEIDDWSQQIIAVHFKEGPDVFSAWSVDETIPETYAGYRIRYENAWQNPGGKIVHWPVNKRPYTSAFAAGGTWKSEVSHACLLSLGVRDGIEWTDHYQVDDRGRKYREWASLVGLNEKGNPDRMRRKTASWLYNGSVQSEKEHLKFVKKDFQRNALVFEVFSNSDEYRFAIGEDQNADVIINPVFKLDNWGADPDISVLVNDRPIPENSVRSAIESNNLLVWVDLELTTNSEVTIQRKNDE